MTELQRLLAAYDDYRAAGRACALATVVEVEGSAYRRPGARMLVGDDGQLTGAISGGCLEGDARQRARQALQQQRPTLVTYDTSDEDDPRHGLGPGCQGVVRILLEPLNFADLDNPLELLRGFALHPEPAVLATVFRCAAGQAVADLGQRLLLVPDGQVRGSALDNLPLTAQLRHDAAQALMQDQSLIREYPAPAGGTVRVILEVLRPPLRLTVYGAGNDAQPLVRLAASLGWQVSVVDGRPRQAAPERFPDAAEVRVVPLAEVPTLPLSADYAVLLTHNYAYDLAVLQRLLDAPTSYIGLLGPRTKAARLLEELNQEVTDAEIRLQGRLYSPVGLNLGAETPEEIALSIVAEIQAVRQGRPGGMLTHTTDPIHARPTNVASPDSEEASDSKARYRHVVVTEPSCGV
ncbi:XdhC/CoxI family protein [Hymenobacter oligotrophus]|uniref:XdhC/CoxI family protein n=1 Tax=Hymenobacter oligotrophus TaxID=2319843 RepID=A0A3B7QY25_9BACT|nr:XdhC/CoxI family protein [Hymenobacter oligotrophus]AYA36133.1 XdhC/CoxI family protein [Hymenobacter oligotrophus]